MPHMTVTHKLLSVPQTHNKTKWSLHDVNFQLQTHFIYIIDNNPVKPDTTEQTRLLHTAFSEGRAMTVDI